jgi:hypothetical protein
MNYEENKCTHNGETYYEHARDIEGTELKVGDTVKIVKYNQSQFSPEYMNRRGKIVEIFQGDLRLEMEKQEEIIPFYGISGCIGISGSTGRYASTYCYPQFVIKVKQHD